MSFSPKEMDFYKVLHVFPLDMALVITEKERKNDRFWNKFILLHSVDNTMGDIIARAKQILAQSNLNEQVMEHTRSCIAGGFVLRLILESLERRTDVFEGGDIDVFFAEGTQEENKRLEIEKSNSFRSSEAA